MKIQKIAKDSTKIINLTELADKINDIIDVLNKSFITDDPDTINIPYDTSFVTGLSIDNNMIEGKSILGNIQCPHCGESYYTELYSTSTSVYYPPIYKDGANINPDRNHTTTYCRCLNCNKEFEI